MNLKVWHPHVGGECASSQTSVFSHVSSMTYFHTVSVFVHCLLSHLTCDNMTSILSSISEDLPPCQPCYILYRSFQVSSAWGQNSLLQFIFCQEFCFFQVLLTIDQNFFQLPYVKSHQYGGIFFLFFDTYDCSKWFMFN